MNNFMDELEWRRFFVDFNNTTKECYIYTDGKTFGREHIMNSAGMVFTISETGYYLVPVPVSKNGTYCLKCGKNFKWVGLVPLYNVVFGRKLNLQFDDIINDTLI